MIYLKNTYSKIAWKFSHASGYSGLDSVQKLCSKIADFYCSERALMPLKLI